MRSSIGSRKSRSPSKSKYGDESTYQESPYKNPLNYNIGDTLLEPYFKPLLLEARGTVDDVGVERLTKLHHLGLLEVFGANVWKGIYSTNWRVRRAAAQAVLNYIEMKANSDTIGSSTNLFLACVELSRMISEDKLLEIYFIGLKIISTCLTPPICNPEFPSEIVSKVLEEFAPILIKKIGELNDRARDISMHTLLTIFSHHLADIGVLVNSCLDLCEKVKIKKNYFNEF